MVKNLAIVLSFLLALSEAAYDKCCIDLEGNCSKMSTWICEYQGGRYKSTCRATCKVCQPSIPAYQNNKITTPQEKVKAINNLCSIEQNKYAGVNLRFHPKMAHYAQLYAEYMVKNGLTNKHDCLKRYNFPGLTTMVGNLNAFFEDKDFGEALKSSIKAWYDSGSNMKSGMTDNQYMGCGVASNGKITRVVSWYGKGK
ncbi:uncharacterized protein [Clytia hemisphaerica]|uniref:SCP domain-containing protein n=1 Tax=Clytia hemisphaerica TaxID=252671 RepID=A0A7M5X0C7_9CNID